MSDTPQLQPSPLIVHSMRDIGRRMSDQGMLEFNIIAGTLTWANNFMLEKLGYTLEQFQTMSIFDITPSGFHYQIRNLIADTIAGKPTKFSIWPATTSDGKVAWWYIFRNETKDPLSWSHGDYIQTTDTNGITYAFMKVTMNATNNYGQLHNQVNELDAWVREQIKRLDDSDQSIYKLIEKLDDKMQHAVDAATKAANTSLDSHKKLSDTREEIKKLINDNNKQLEDKFAEQTGEILKLIGGDYKRDERIERFEKRIELITDLSINAITTQAKKASKGISRKVTIPVSVIAGFFALIQFILQNWGNISKWFKPFSI
jgi:hypothetical protein